MVDPRVRFGAALRGLRDERGLTQEALGHQAGVHPVEVSRLETGQRDPQMTTLLKLAGVFDVSLDTLVGKTEATGKKNLDGT